MLGLGLGLNKLRSSGLSSYLKGAMVWGFKSKYKWGETSTDIWGFANPTDIDPEATTIYNRIIADGGVSNITRLNYFVVGLKTIYATLDNVPVCYDAHWIGYKLGSGTGATAGQAAAKLYSLTVAGDAVQATAASQPLLLSHNGASSDNYWFGSGVTGNYVSTPNASANQITGDIDVKTTAKYIFNASYDVFIAKWGAAQSFRFYISPTDRLTVELGGMTGATSTIAITSIMNHFRFTRNSTNGNILFYYSNEAITTDINSVTWIQLGTTVVGGTGAFTSSTNTLNIGQDGTSNPFAGKIYRATIANSIGGAPVVDFNPASYNASTSQTQWTSATGEIWTINTGTATSGYKGLVVTKTLVQTDGVDDFIRSGTLTSRTIYTRYLAITPLNTGTQYVFAGSGAVNHLNYKKATNTFLLYNGTSEIILSSISPYLKQLFTSDLNGSSSLMRLNNGSDSTANLSVTASTSVTFGTDGVGTLFANSILQTVIETNSVDTNTTKTAMYNLIRSLNENAF